MHVGELWEVIEDCRITEELAGREHWVRTGEIFLVIDIFERHPFYGAPIVMITNGRLHCCTIMMGHMQTNFNHIRTFER